MKTMMISDNELAKKLGEISPVPDCPTSRLQENFFAQTGIGEIEIGSRRKLAFGGFGVAAALALMVSGSVFYNGLQGNKNIPQPITRLETPLNSQNVANNPVSIKNPNLNQSAKVSYSDLYAVSSTNIDSADQFASELIGYSEASNFSLSDNGL